MRHIFVINPHAGPKDSERTLERKLSARKDAEVYHTSCPGDATRFVRETCRSSAEPMRFYACGGDGTLNETVNGVVGFDHAAVGCCPCGSGNDFVKYFGGKEPFLDLDAQFGGTEQYIDLIKANGRYCVNAGNFGLESAVVRYMVQVKNKPLLSGTRAYLAGVVKAFVKDMRTKCHIVADGEELVDGDVLLGNFANGSYVGSAFCCAPRSEMDDGKMELCVMKPVSRLKFLTLASGYAKGTHLDDPRYKPMCIYRRCSRLEVKSPEPEFTYLMDGEIISGRSFTAEVIHKGVRLVVPRGLEKYLKNRAAVEPAV